MQRYTGALSLIVTRDSTLAEHLVGKFHALDWIAVPTDRWETALAMMHVVTFSVVIVEVARACDWHTCRRLVESGSGVVAIVTSFIAEDGSYRRFAFELGIAAYALRTCARDRLHEMLWRLQRGERRIELVTSTGHRLRSKDHY